MKKIGVIGTGTMGLGIIQVMAQNEFEVYAKSIRGNGTEILEKITISLERLISKGKISSDDMNRIINKITVIKDDSQLEDCDLIIEATIEEIEAKKQLFKYLDGICKDETIFATNTSSLSITDIASVTNRSEKVIGMHFFNPATIMNLVEVIKGLQTSENTYNIVTDLVMKLNKTPVMVNEAPGFIVNRILIPMINEAIGIYADGVASIEDIDLAMKLGANHPLGPLALCDLIGLDICLNIMEEIHSKTNDNKYRPNNLLKKYVRAGWLGRKTKRGFYKY